MLSLHLNRYPRRKETTTFISFQFIYSILFTPTYSHRYLLYVSMVCELSFTCYHLFSLHFVSVISFIVTTLFATLTPTRHFFLTYYPSSIKHELCSELAMHYISFTFKQSLTALSNACSSAFNLFLSFLFTSTYSHRCYHYFQSLLWRKNLKLLCTSSLLLYLISNAIYSHRHYTILCSLWFSFGFLLFIFHLTL